MAGTSCLLEWATSKGHQPAPKERGIEQQINRRELQAFRRACEDPDVELSDAHAQVVKLGYKMHMPALQPYSLKNKNGGSHMRGGRHARNVASKL